MNKSLLVVAAMPLVVLGCSAGSEPKAVEITFPLGEPGATMSLSGEAVEDGLLCDAATVERLGFEDLDGNPMTGEEVNAIAGESTDFVWYDELTCVDGSGSWVILGEQLIPMSEMDMNGPNEAATSWTVDRGSGDYESLSGSGTDTVDFGAGLLVSTGEVQVD